MGDDDILLSSRDFPKELHGRDDSAGRQQRQREDMVGDYDNGNNKDAVMYDEYEQPSDGKNAAGCGNLLQSDEDLLRECGSSVRSSSSRCVSPTLPPKRETGIPNFPLIMRVDIQGKFGKEKSLLTFQGKFGNLPQRAMMDVTEMMYRPDIYSSSHHKHHAGGRKRDRDDSSSHLQSGEQVVLPKDIFLPEPR